MKLPEIKKTMEDLPNELLIEIFKLLTDRLSILSRVCSLWKQLIESFYESKQITTDLSVACETESLYKFFKQFDDNELTCRHFSDVFSKMKLNQKIDPILFKLCHQHFSIRLFEILVSFPVSLDLIVLIESLIPDPRNFHESKNILTWSHIPLFFLWNKNNHVWLPWYQNYLKQKGLTIDDMILMMGEVDFKSVWRCYWKSSFENWFVIHSHVSHKNFKMLFKEGRRFIFPKLTFTNFEDNFIHLQRFSQLFCKHKRFWLKKFGQKVLTCSFYYNITIDVLIEYTNRLNVFFGDDFNWRKSRLFERFVCKCVSLERYDLICETALLDILPHTFIRSELIGLSDKPAFLENLLELHTRSRSNYRKILFRDLIVHLLNESNVHLWKDRILGKLYKFDFPLPLTPFLFGWLQTNCPHIIEENIKPARWWSVRFNTNLFKQVLPHFSDMFQKQPEIKENAMFCLHNLIYNNVCQKYYPIPVVMWYDLNYKQFFIKLAEINTTLKIFKDDLDTSDFMNFHFEIGMVLFKNVDSFWFHVKFMHQVETLLKHQIPFPPDHSKFERFKLNHVAPTVLKWLNLHKFSLNTNELIKRIVHLDRFDLFSHFACLHQPSVITEMENYLPQHRLVEFRKHVDSRRILASQA